MHFIDTQQQVQSNTATSSEQHSLLLLILWSGLLCSDVLMLPVCANGTWQKICCGKVFAVALTFVLLYTPTLAHV